MTVIINGTGGVTYPDSTTQASANISAANITSGTLAIGRLPAGSVLQVVNGSNSTQITTTSTSYSDTGLSLSITPTSASNKILIMVSQFVATVTDNTLQWKLFSGANTIVTMTSAAASQYAGTIGSCLSYTYLDNPATTSSVTYKTQFASRDNSETVYVNLNNTTSTITLLEIAA
jgi:hypothetical protein